MIFDRLRAEIMAGTLMLGDELTQDEIADRFRVSRIPVREALRMLAMERLVELRPHRKAIVRKYSSSEIEDIFLIRSLLEKGLLKARNFRRAQNKLQYAYLLTPKGIAAKVRLTRAYLARKETEYEALQAEIQALRQEVKTTP